MVEELQAILNTLGDLGEAAIWVVVTYFVFKLATLASILLVAIIKLHDWAKTKKISVIEKSVVWKLDQQVIGACDEPTALKLKQVLDEAKLATGGYLHERDVDRLLKLVREANVNECTN
jgi:hypothetical protein